MCEYFNFVLKLSSLRLGHFYRCKKQAGRAGTNVPPAHGFADIEAMGVNGDPATNPILHPVMDHKIPAPHLELKIDPRGIS